jgi:hypothetical protein
MGMCDFTPGYVKSSPSGSRRPVARNSMKKDMGPSGPSGSRKVISVTLQHEVQLNKAEKAWKPAMINKKETTADDSVATAVGFTKLFFIFT